MTTMTIRQYNQVKRGAMMNRLEPKQPFHKYDQITWSIWGRIFINGRRKVVHHQGTIVGIIPEGMMPYEVDSSYRGVASTAAPRDHESYIVEEDNKLYWPRVSSLFAGRSNV